MLSRLRPIWPLLAALASAAMLAAAHLYFQRMLSLQPCPLCLDQRNWHWGVLATGLVAFVLLRFKPRWSRFAAIVVGVVLLGSFVQAAYHVAVEQHWVTAQCDARANLDDLTLPETGAAELPRCDAIAWSMFGISMAGYNAIISLLLALASFAVAIAPERRT